MRPFLLALLGGSLPLTVQGCGGTSICEVGGGGNVLPLFGDAEQGWPMLLRMVLYFFGLMWCFIGVGIVSDVFMAAIEVITAKEKHVRLANGGTVKVKVWNATVANLTLMALGSSAPEILLSVIELCGDSFFAGDLGPSTIVGSAAFNLLIIIAVCISAIAAPDVRKIQDMNVFTITASSSIFAYVWLLIILQGITPNVVTLWEAVLTLLFFPMLVAIAYLADIGYFSDRKVVPSHILKIGQHAVKPFELTELLGRLSSKRKHKITPDEALNMYRNLSTQNEKPSRAQLRINAMRMMTGGKRVLPKEKKTKVDIKRLRRATCVDANVNAPHIMFACATYHCLESDGTVSLTVERSPAIGETKVRYHTENGTAEAGLDYNAIDGTLVFAEGETSKIIKVPITDDDEAEEDEYFFCILSDADGGALGTPDRCTITIVDDDEPGMIGFDAADQTVDVLESCGQAVLWVTRKNGAAGRITCNYTTEPGSAVADVDYKPISGELVFEAGEVKKPLHVSIIDEKSYEKKETFKVCLSNLKGPNSKVKWCGTYEAEVVISSDQETKELIDDVTKLMAINNDQFKVGTSSWRQQFEEAWQVSGEEGEDGGENDAPGAADYVMHVISLPWKLLFALIPPTDIWDGKVTFVVALIFIGGVTAIIGDMAALFGCVIGLKDSVTAITFVALGTSLPDTFASKSAAEADDTADAAIGNVTGSNSVNVFLGLGLPWTMAAIFWGSKGEATSDWQLRFGGPTGPGCDLRAPNLFQEYPNGAFAVPAGSLGFSVMVFSLCAVTCIALLVVRRKVVGAELGGPTKAARLSSAVLCSLWFFYVLISALQAYESF